MDTAALTSLTQVARQLKLDRRTVGDVVRTLGIQPKRIVRGRGLGGSKGLDASDIAVIRKALRLTGASSDRVSA